MKEILSICKYNKKELSTHFLVRQLPVYLSFVYLINYFTAITSISIKASNGNLPTWKAERAGQSVLKYSA